MLPGTLQQDDEIKPVVLDPANAMFYWFFDMQVVHGIWARIDVNLLNWEFSVFCLCRLMMAQVPQTPVSPVCVEDRRRLTPSSPQETASLWDFSLALPDRAGASELSSGKASILWVTRALEGCNDAKLQKLIRAWYASVQIGRLAGVLAVHTFYTSSFALNDDDVSGSAHLLSTVFLE